MKKFTHVAVGGTFDRMHKGHEQLLEKALAIGARVTVGVTTKEMVQKKKMSDVIEPYSTRKRHVAAFFEKAKKNTPIDIVGLSDPLGPLRSNSTIDAVVVGPRVPEETVRKIESRIPVVRCRTIYAEDGSYLSSTRIRKGEVDRDGALFTIPTQTIFLPKNMRKTLQKPLGNVISNKRLLSVPVAGSIIAVGDESARRLVESGTVPDIAVVDLHVQRVKKYASVSDIGYSQSVLKKQRVTVTDHIVNKPGTLDPGLFSAIQRAFKMTIEEQKKSLLVIDGEDDLATLAAIQCSPLGAVLWYGQPHAGIARVDIHEKTKGKIRELIRRFHGHSE